MKRVRFTALLAEGNISVQDDGFTISLATTEGDAPKLEAIYLEDPTGSKLPHRIRFTLAHEIAHTFFFDLKTRPPKSKINYADPRSVRTLEAACHEVAGVLPLPNQIISRTVWRVGVFATGRLA